MTVSRLLGCITIKCVLALSLLEAEASFFSWRKDDEYIRFIEKTILQELEAIRPVFPAEEKTFRELLHQVKSFPTAEDSLAVLQKFMEVVSSEEGEGPRTLRKIEHKEVSAVVRRCLGHSEPWVRYSLEELQAILNERVTVLIGGVWDMESASVFTQFWEPIAASSPEPISPLPRVYQGVIKWTHVLNSPACNCYTETTETGRVPVAKTYRLSVLYMEVKFLHDMVSLWIKRRALIKKA